jgi:hypothetical protein
MASTYYEVNGIKYVMEIDAPEQHIVIHPTQMLKLLDNTTSDKVTDIWIRSEASNG